MKQTSWNQIFARKMSVPLKCMTVHHHPLKVMNQPYRLSVQKGHPIPSFPKLISRAIPLDGHQPPQRPTVVYFFPVRKKDQKYRHSAPPPSPSFRLPFSKKGNFFSEIFLSSKGADTATPSEITFLGGDHLSSGNLIQRGVRILNGMAVVKLRLQCC